MTPGITTALHCTNPNCKYHHPEACKGHSWYYSHGRFYTKARGWISRFRCKTCGKTCSTQSFSIHYWTHSTLDFYSIARAVTSCSGLLQLARLHKVTYRVIQNRIRRLARNCLFLSAKVLYQLILGEDLVFDGFESYIRTQMHPNNINILSGADSQFLYCFTLSHIRRKGTMTKGQKWWRDLIEEHWQPEKGAVYQGIRRLFFGMQRHIAEAATRNQAEMKHQKDAEGPKSTGNQAKRGRSSPFILYSDQHKAYHPALRSIPELRLLMDRGQVEHRQISSKEPRTVYNNLFSVNYLDRQFRKDLGEHVRETVKQGRESNCQMERMAIYQVMNNFFTPHRVRHVADFAAEPTHADVAGIDRRIYWKEKEELFTRRFLRSHLQQRDIWVERTWKHEHVTPPSVKMVDEDVVVRPMGIRPEQLSRHLAA